MKKLVKPTLQEIDDNQMAALNEGFCTCETQVCECQTRVCKCRERSVFSDFENDEILF